MCCDCAISFVVLHVAVPCLHFVPHYAVMRNVKVFKRGRCRLWASVTRSVFPAFFQRRLVSFYYLLEALGKPASRRRLDARSLEFGTLDERSPASWSWKKENFEAREKGLITASHCNCSSLVWARAYITDNRCVPFTEGSRVKALFVNYRK